MPTYQYGCENCGKTFERTETISEHEALKPPCPKCERPCLRGDDQKELDPAGWGLIFG